MSFITSIQEITICASMQLQTKYLCLKISQYNIIKKTRIQHFFGGWGEGSREGAKMICYVALDTWRENK